MAKDLFSKQSAHYARYRPSYPTALIDYIISFVQQADLAWDCATGNGQAALLLAPHFKKVMATDLSDQQLQQAPQKDNIFYSASKAEQTTFADNSFNLVTIAQAYHWFRFKDFELEVTRVAKPGAVVAAWGYNIPVCTQESINALVHHFYTAVVGPYWDAERKWVDDKYSTIPFNFSPLPEKNFAITVSWCSDDLTGYLNSWSSVQHFIKANGYNPVVEIATQLVAAWPKNKTFIAFSFPVFLRLGRVLK